MARRRRYRKKRNWSSLNVFSHLQEETIQSIVAIALFVISLFLLLSSWGTAGIVGEKTYDGLTTVLGLGYFLLPVVFIILGISFIRTIKKIPALTQTIGAFVFFVTGLGMLDMAFEKGGAIGGWISSPLIKLFDAPVAFTILLALMIISFLVIFDIALKINLSFFSWIKEKLFKKKEEGVKITGEGEESEEEEENETETDEEEMEDEEEPEIKKPVTREVAKNKEDSGFETGFTFSTLSNHKPYTPPPLKLLERDKGKPEVGDIKANANIIKRTLQNFGISVEMDEISIGPSVTRYALKPAEGVKLSKIVGLQNDLALALAAHPLRIEAPIPGKSLVGIEIPNTVKTTVGLGSMLASQEFQKSDKSLLVSLGKAISGNSQFGNIAKMPHLLIAGATGSGKSVTIHALITSLLYRNSPENLKFIMIDPKRVELTLYNKIPHLLTPVITDAKKSILALKWAAKEMDRRYDILESEAVRDIESYHKNVLGPALKKAEKSKDEDQELPETMPYIVIIIDELADIMQAYPRELEAAVVRLAQMSRAVGIHLILSTQRPSVNVITGLIKANVPARIALQVSSQVDSRTILDTGGAEKLLGAGDMLYMSGEMSKPQRLQSSFISEAEVKDVAKFLANSYRDEITDEINFTENTEKDPLWSAVSDDEEDEDDLYEEAREAVIQAKKASTSYLQRKLRVGYARAARLIDMLEERGVVGPGEGAKPREVLEGNEGGYGEKNEDE